MPASSDRTPIGARTHADAFTTAATCAALDSAARLVVAREECRDCAGYVDEHERDCPRFAGPIGLDAMDVYDRKQWREESEE